MTTPSALVATTPVFTNGEHGVACYRIPAIVRMATGELLAVAEGRVVNCLDHGGPIRVVAKIGDPTGEHWSEVITIAKNVLPDGIEEVAQNPSPVVDLLDPEHPGKIVVMFNKAEHGERAITERAGVRRFFVIESLDHGRTWVNERDITSEVHKPNLPHYTRVHEDAAERYNHPEDWRACFTTVGHAIQLQGGRDGSLPTRGRLLFANYLTQGDATILQGQAHLVYSDDHGKTWVNGDPSPVRGPNEMMSVERANGDVLVNFRNYSTPEFTTAEGRGQFTFVTREDGTYEVPTDHVTLTELPMPGFGLQGAIHRVADTPDGPLLYSGADNRETRTGMTVWRSDDEGDSWQVLHKIDPGPSAYSDLVTLTDGRAGLLYELGGDDGIVFCSFSPDHAE